MEPVRLYVGGLAPGVSAEALQQRFAPFGTATVHMLPAKTTTGIEGGSRSYCYVDLLPKDGSSLHKCLSAVSAQLTKA